MKKEIIRIELNGKIIGSKPLFFNDNLKSIRFKLKEKIKEEYIFLDKDGNNIDKEDENDYILKDIEIEKVIRIKNSEKMPELKIFLNDKNIYSIIYNYDENIYNLRDLLKDKINENYIFLDKDKNPVERDDEKDYCICDILNINNKIYLINDNYKSNSQAPPISNQITNVDFSKFEIKEKREDLIIYSYSNKERISSHKFVYQYFYDKFDIADHINAYIILFCGKKGDGKRTAINAFLNIVKGIKSEDKYRFILIKEKTETKGVHLYYLRDYNNKPLIIIDFQGYEDIDGKKYDDEMVNEAFSFIFSNIIDHINTVCFIYKSNVNRTDSSIKYIFSNVISLFSEDIIENFIVLGTFANRDTIMKGPSFIESFKTDFEFLKNKDRINDKWWYALDSKCILDNEKDKLSKYSFSQLNELYEEKIKKLKPKSIKKSAEILFQSRKELKIQVNVLIDTYKNLLIEQQNLKEKEKVIKEINNKIKNIEEKIKCVEIEYKNINYQNLEQKIIELNDELNKKLNLLNSESEIEYYNSLEYHAYNIYTHCDKCKINCHNPCDCLGSSLGRCSRFSSGIISYKICEYCGCLKDSHKIDHYHWIKKSNNKNKDNSFKIIEEKKRNEKEKERYLEELNNKNKIKYEIEKQKRELNWNKNILFEEKNKNIKKKIEIEEKIRNISNQITIIIIKIQNIKNRINDITGNQIKNENDFFDSLIKNVQNEEIKSVLKIIKE